MAQDPDGEQLLRWHRWFAVECNNLGWDLAERPGRTAEATLDMVDAAHAAAFHWARIGDERNRARADLLLGRVHTLAGNGELGLRYARRAYEYVAATPSPEWEVALAHAVLAHAAEVAGDVALYTRHYRQAQRLGGELADPGDREVFLATFGVVPEPRDRGVER